MTISQVSPPFNRVTIVQVVDYCLWYTGMVYKNVYFYFFLFVKIYNSLTIHTDESTRLFFSFLCVIHSCKTEEDVELL